MFPVGFRFPSKEGEASSEAERSPLLRLRDGLVPLPEGGRSFPPFLQKRELPCCFLLSMTCRAGSACAPGPVLASARRKSLRTGSTPSAASKGCASIPVRGVCSSCMPTTKPSGPRSCCWLWPLRNSLPGMSPCAAKTSPSQPEGRVGGLSSAISLSGRSCRFSSGCHGGGGLRSLYPQRGCRVVPRAPQCGCP